MADRGGSPAPRVLRYWAHVVDKRKILEVLRARLRAELSGFAASQSAAQEGAVHEETRQEDPKDTRAIEAQYLARGLAERVETLRRSVAALGRLDVVDFDEGDPIGLTALVTLRETEGSDDAVSVYFLVPAAGGETVELDGKTIRTVTPASPIGAALMGQLAGDEIELELPARRVVWTVEEIG